MKNGIPTVKIVNPDNRAFISQCYIDDVELSNVTGIEFKQEVGRVPEFIFDVNGLPEIDMFGEVCFKFSPKTIQEAAIVLIHEFKTNPESYKALISSIESILRDVPMHAWDSEKAEMIAKRVIGLEN